MPERLIWGEVRGRSDQGWWEIVVLDDQVSATRTPRDRVITIPAFMLPARSYLRRIGLARAGGDAGYWYPVVYPHSTRS